MTTIVKTEIEKIKEKIKGVMKELNVAIEAVSFDMSLFFESKMDEGEFLTPEELGL